MSSLPSLVLLAIFVASAVVIWAAGIKLSDYTDVLPSGFISAKPWAAWCCWLWPPTCPR